MSDASGGNVRAEGRVLIDDFAKAWEKGNVDRLIGVFSANPVFVEDPFTAPLSGMTAVRGYFEDIPKHQAEVTFTTGEIYAAGPWFSTEFKLVFRRRRTGDWVEARGAIFCETDGGKISEMRMYWHRK